MLPQTHQWVKTHGTVQKGPENILNFMPQDMIQSINLGPLKHLMMKFKSVLANKHISSVQNPKKD